MTSKELALPLPTDLAAAFGKDETVDALIDAVRQRVREHAPDVTTAKGRDAIRSLAFAVARSKTALDDAGKKLTEDQKRQIDAVNAQRRKIRDQLDALRDEARKPLDDWEAVEAKRKDDLQERLRAFDPLEANQVANITASGFAVLIADIEAIAIDETWQERQADAETSKEKCLVQLRVLHAAAVDREAQAAELARLRAQAAEREAQQAAEREAEEKRQQAERQKAEIEAAELAAKQRAEQAAAERIAAAEKEAEEARKQAERAAQAERDRAEAERRRIAEEEEARARNVAHVQKIRRAAKEALMSIGLTEDHAVDVVLAIHRGSIPNLTISY